MELILIFAAFLLFALSFVFVILYGIWKIPYIGKYASVAAGMALMFFVITAIWPMDSFYVDDFQRNSNLVLPDGYEVLDKQSSYPDMHGDYFSEAIFKIDYLDIAELSKDIEEMEKCTVPKIAMPYLDKQKHTVQCWAVKRNSDEFFNFTYIKESNLLHYRFDQT